MSSRNQPGAATTALGRYWDEVVQNLPADPGDLDPALRATVHHLRAHDDSPGPDPAFAGRLLQDLLASTATGSPAAGPRLPRYATVERPERLFPDAAPRPSVPLGGRRWPALPFATLALLLVTVVVSVVAFADVRPWAQVLAPLMLPASTPSADLISDDILLQGPPADIPAGSDRIRLGRTVLPAGTDWTFDDNDSAGLGLYRLESGALTISADGPITVTRQGVRAAESIPAGAEIKLAPGDQGFTPAGVHTRWRTAATAPATILNARITPSFGVPPTGVRPSVIVDDFAFAPPSGPVVVTVRRVVLPPAATLRVDDVPGLHLLYIEAGDLHAVDAQHPDGFRVVNGTDVTRRFPSGRVLQATGTEPATLLLLAVTPISP